MKCVLLDFVKVRKLGVFNVIIEKERETRVFDAIMKMLEKPEISPRFRKKVFFSGSIFEWSGSREIVSGVYRARFVIFTFFVKKLFFFTKSFCHFIKFIGM